MQLLCPACCSEEVGPHPDEKAAELRCANCGEGFDRSEAHITVAEAESHLPEPVPERMFDLDLARARAALANPDGPIRAVDPDVGADELHRLLDAAQAKDVIRARCEGATIVVHPYSVAEPDPLVAVRLDRGPTLLGPEPNFRADEDEDPVAYTVRLLEGMVATANRLVAGRASDSGRLDRIAAFLNANRPWSGGDVCEFLADEIVASGRRLLDAEE
jgi:hypothetical protein